MVALLELLVPVGAVELVDPTTLLLELESLFELKAASARPGW